MYCQQNIQYNIRKTKGAQLLKDDYLLLFEIKSVNENHSKATGILT